MGLQDGLEKLVTGHGSATILDERLALAAETHAAPEQEVAARFLKLQVAADGSGCRHRLPASGRALQKIRRP